MEYCLDITRSPRFDCLDALRGVAAIAVMIFHYTQHNGLHWLAGAWVSVDLFFILSGFVLAHSYGEKIISGMPFKKFITIRLIRLGPLYLLGLFTGLLAALLSLRSAHSIPPTISQIFSAFGLNALGLPYFNNINWSFGLAQLNGAIFPLNDPAWSIFFELFVNIIFYFYAFSFRKYSSYFLVILSAIVSIYIFLKFGIINPGWGRDNFIYAFPRVIAEFFLGALIYIKRTHFEKISSIIVLMITIFVLLLFTSERWAMLNSVTMIPLSLAFLSTIKINVRWRKLAEQLGNISYPLYILHFPIYRLFFQFTKIQLLHPITQMMMIAGTCVLISILITPLDLKIRNWLSQALMASPTS